MSAHETPDRSAIESGDSSGSVVALQRIAEALEVSVDDLLSAAGEHSVEG